MKKIKKLCLLLCCITLVFGASAQKINRGEYFFDTDPGIGNGTPIPAFTNFNDSTLNLSINTSALATGSHYLFMRFCNAGNVWGQYEGRQFYVYNQPTVTPVPSPSVVAGEYFFDTDPGIGNGTSIPAFTAFNDATLTLTPNTATLTEGSHYLFTRFKDATGVWGQYEGRHFYVYNQPTVTPAVSPSVIAGEYFFDTDPGFGNGTPIPSITAFSNATINLAANSAGTFTIGTHYLYSRFKDANGLWGHYEGRSFTVCAVVPVAQFSVNNGCAGTPLTIVNSSSNAATYAWDINNDGTTDYAVAGNVSHTYASAGTFTIKLTTTSSSGCTNTQTASVNVYTLPVVSVSGGSICSGNSFTIVPSGANTYTINGSGSNFTVSPGATAAYSVTGTSTNGCVSATAAISNVTVYATPSVAATSGTVCSGKSFTITPSGASTYTINGSGNNFTVSPTANTAYSVTGTSTAGCVSMTTAISNVTVHIPPTVSVTSGSVCSGNSFTITPSGANTYTINGSGSNFTVSPTANTDYSVTGTSTAGCVSTATAISSVTVFATPTIAVNSGSICSGNSFTITRSGANTYTLNGTGNNFTVSPNTTTAYSVTGTSTAGCISATQAISNVTVHATPTVAVTGGSVCSGNAFTLVPSGASSYTLNGSSNNFTVTPGTTTTYSVTGTSTAGCISGNTVMPVVTVNTTPTVSVNSGSICSGNSFTLIPSGADTYTVNGGNNFTVSPGITSTYSVSGTSTAGCMSAIIISSVAVYVTPTVSVNSGSICSGNAFTIVPSGATTYTLNGSGSNFTVSPAATEAYSVTGTSTAGCVSSNTAVANVTVNITPTVSVNSGSICAGSSFTITPSGANSYTVTGNNFTVSPAASTSYSLAGTSSLGCPSSNTAVSNVTVNALPSVIIAPSSQTICSQESATLTASGAVSYTWSTGTSATIIVINPTQTSSYTLTGIDHNGCSNTSNFILVVDPCTGIIYNKKDTGLKIYPNPNNGEFSIEITNDAELEIFSATGQQVISKKLRPGKNLVNIDEYAKGVYFVQINQNGKVYNSRIIKQ